jgi:hypothetical protein
VTDMKVTVWLRRKTGLDRFPLKNFFCSEVLFDFLLDKVFVGVVSVVFRWLSHDGFQWSKK